MIEETDHTTEISTHFKLLALFSEFHFIQVLTEHLHGNLSFVEFGRPSQTYTVMRGLRRGRLCLKDPIPIDVFERRLFRLTPSLESAQTLKGMYDLIFHPNSPPTFYAALETGENLSFIGATNESLRRHQLRPGTEIFRLSVRLAPPLDVNEDEWTPQHNRPLVVIVGGLTRPSGPSVGTPSTNTGVAVVGTPTTLSPIGVRRRGAVASLTVVEEVVDTLGDPPTIGRLLECFEDARYVDVKCLGPLYKRKHGRGLKIPHLGRLLKYKSILSAYPDQFAVQHHSYEPRNGPIETLTFLTNPHATIGLATQKRLTWPLLRHRLLRLINPSPYRAALASVMEDLYNSAYGGPPTFPITGPHGSIRTFTELVAELKPDIPKFELLLPPIAGPEDAPPDQWRVRWRTNLHHNHALESTSSLAPTINDQNCAPAQSTSTLVPTPPSRNISSTIPGTPLRSLRKRASTSRLVLSVATPRPAPEPSTDTPPPSGLRRSARRSEAEARAAEARAAEARAAEARAAEARAADIRAAEMRAAEERTAEVKRDAKRRASGERGKIGKRRAGKVRAVEEGVPKTVFDDENSEVDGKEGEEGGDEDPMALLSGVERNVVEALVGMRKVVPRRRKLEG
ncbi:hypothetical protein BC938DRAFT_480664 [Jimgerdemannia flammicorona]|uniref:Uncharacterized protein n=1 Tax=Jimgerdemannia flammicorona TaxID=994334 RepID=A0A433QI03_9FUNG|nr:hypothetical protein BC938DRAFT_480664 [Jimgerdemannia flammicorona]